MSNASLAFDKSAVVAEYKAEIETLQKDKDATSKKLGEVIVARDFLEGKLVSLVSFDNRKEMIDTEYKLSLNK